MRKYKAKKMFAGDGAYFVEVSEGKSYRNWLKDGEVRVGLRHLLIPDGLKLESAQCPSWAYARALARGMAYDDARERRGKLVSSVQRGGRDVTYAEWVGWCHQWRSGGYIHSKTCHCGIPEPRLKPAKEIVVPAV